MSGPQQSANKPGSDPVREALAIDKPLFGAVAMFSGAMSMLALTTSFYMLQVYDRVLSSRSVETLMLLTVIATVAIAVFSVLDALRQRLLARIGMRFASRLSTRVLRATVAASSVSGGSAIRSGLRDIDTIRSFIASPGMGALFDAPFAVLYLVVLLLLDPWFLAIVLVGGAILVAIALANQRATNAPLKSAIQYSTRAQEFADDGVRNSDVLEGMGMSGAFVARWRAQWLLSLAAGTQAGDNDSFYGSLSRSVRLLIQIFCWAPARS